KKARCVQQALSSLRSAADKAGSTIASRYSLALCCGRARPSVAANSRPATKLPPAHYHLPRVARGQGAAQLLVTSSHHQALEPALSPQLIQQRLRLLQIARVEPLSEPAVDRRE